MIRFKASLKIMVVVALILVACGTRAAGAASIDTTPSWDGSSFIFPFGNGPSNTATYGAVVTALIIE